MATVLTAEDNLDNSALLALMLERAGHSVLPTGDGPTALRTARSNSPDLAILDGRMPGLSGVEVCRALKADPVTARLPIIFVTASVEEHDIRDAFAAGAGLYLVKPFRPRDLLTCVDMMLEHPTESTTAKASAASMLASLAAHRLHAANSRAGANAFASTILLAPSYRPMGA
jgi:CheY-like chemotaxis protein